VRCLSYIFTGIRQTLLRYGCAEGTLIIYR